MNASKFNTGKRRLWHVDGNDDSTNDSNLTQAINDLAMKGEGGYNISNGNICKMSLSYLKKMIYY